MLRTILILAVTAIALGGCLSDTRSGLSDTRDSLSGGFSKNTDTYGTSSRPDVYGEFTRPTLPTMGSPGYGK